MGESVSCSSTGRSPRRRIRSGPRRQRRCHRSPGCCGLHDAAHGFDPHDHSWDDRLADPAGGTLVCTTTWSFSNVVFRDGVAVALIDFEFAALDVLSTTWPSSPACASRSTTTSTRPGSAGGPPTGRRGCDSLPMPTDSIGTAGRVAHCDRRCERPHRSSCPTSRRRRRSHHSGAVEPDRWQWAVRPPAPLVDRPPRAVRRRPALTSRGRASDVVRSRRDGALSSRNGLPDEV